MLPYHNISSTLDFTHMHQPPPPVVTGENIVSFPFLYRFADISDADLDQSVTAVKEQMPDVGERMITGALRSNGIHVPRRRVRQSLHRVDLINVALRWRPRIQRRPSSVHGPNSLWHLGKLLNCLNVILLQHTGSHIIIIICLQVLLVRNNCYADGLKLGHDLWCSENHIDNFCRWTPQVGAMATGDSWCN